MRTRSAVLLGSVPLLLTQFACSVTPTYRVRVVNDSNTTLTASIVNTNSITRPETLAEARVSPKDEVVLGPVKAPPLEQVELRIGQPGDMGTLPVRNRLGRGNWKATVLTTHRDAWEPYSVSVEKE